MSLYLESNMFDLQFTNFGTTMAKLRSILMPVAILLGILLPQAHVLSPALPFMIGLMMFLTFVGKVPPQQHGYTFKIEVKAFLASLVMLAVLWGVVEFFQLPREVLLGGAIICLPMRRLPWRKCSVEIRCSRLRFF